MSIPSTLKARVSGGIIAFSVSSLTIILMMYVLYTIVGALGPLLYALNPSTTSGPYAIFLSIQTYIGVAFTLAGISLIVMAAGLIFGIFNWGGGGKQ